MASDNRDPVAESPPEVKRRRTLVALSRCCSAALRLGCLPADAPPKAASGTEQRAAGQGCRGRQSAPLLASTMRAKSMAGMAASAYGAESHARALFSRPRGTNSAAGRTSRRLSACPPPGRQDNHFVFHVHSTYKTSHMDLR